MKRILPLLLLCICTSTSYSDLGIFLQTSPSFAISKSNLYQDDNYLSPIVSTDNKWSCLIGIGAEYRYEQTSFEFGINSNIYKTAFSIQNATVSPFGGALSQEIDLKLAGLSFPAAISVRLLKRPFTPLIQLGIAPLFVTSAKASGKIIPLFGDAKDSSKDIASEIYPFHLVAQASAGCEARFDRFCLALTAGYDKMLLDLVRDNLKRDSFFRSSVASDSIPKLSLSSVHIALRACFLFPTPAKSTEQYYD